MNFISNDNFLSKQLVEINNKYESCTFIDLDFIELFGLNKKSNNSTNTYTNHNLDQVKKKIITRYYSLALKYHQDKFNTSSVDNVIHIKNCFINVDEIKSGLFMSYINDIYEMLLNVITIEPFSIIDILNGTTNNLSNKNELANNTFFDLKRRVDRRNTYIKPSDEQIKEFNDEIKKTILSENKITDKELEQLIDIEQDKRQQLKIDPIFTEDERSKPEFSTVFNNEFDKSFEEPSIETFNIQPYNFNSNFDSGQGTIDTICSLNPRSSEISISDLKEAFLPLRISKNISKNVTYDEMLANRETQSNLFKNAKQIKLNN
jgi:hypothetical protein